MKTVLAPAQLVNCAISFEIESDETEFEEYGLLRGSVSVPSLSSIEVEEDRQGVIEICRGEIESYLLCNGFKMVTDSYHFENEYGSFVAVKRNESFWTPLKVAVGVASAGLTLFGLVKLIK